MLHCNCYIVNNKNYGTYVVSCVKTGVDYVLFRNNKSEKNVDSGKNAIHRNKYESLFINFLRH